MYEPEELLSCYSLIAIAAIKVLTFAYGIFPSKSKRHSPSQHFLFLFIRLHLCFNLGCG